MTFGTLTKEHMKLIGIGSAIALIVLVLGLVGIKFSFASIADVKMESAELTTKIEQAERALAKLPSVESGYKQTVGEIKSHMENIPPTRNYYSWATEIIYGEGRSAALEIESVDEMNTPDKTNGLTGDKPLQFESYGLRIVAKGSYEQVKDFVKNVEERYPLVRFTGLEINVSDKREAHGVQMFIEWPMYPRQIEQLWAAVDSVRRDRQKYLGSFENKQPAVASIQPAKQQDVASTRVEPAVQSKHQVAQEPKKDAVAESKPPQRQPIKKPIAVTHQPPVVQPMPVAPEASKVNTPVKEPVVKSNVVASPPVIKEPDPVVRNPVEPKQEAVVKTEPEVVPKPEVVVKPEVASTEQPTIPEVKAEPKPIEPPALKEQDTPQVAKDRVPDAAPEPIVPPVLATEEESKDDDSLEALLASISGAEDQKDPMSEAPAEKQSIPSETVPHNNQHTDDELGALLASLENQSNAPQPEKQDVPANAKPETKIDGSEMDALLAMHAVNSPKDEKPAEVANHEPNPEPVVAVNPETVGSENVNVAAASTKPAINDTEENEIGALLASLGSRGSEQAQESAEPEPTEASSDAEDLEAYLKQLKKERAIAKEQEAEKVEPESKPVEPIADEYVSTERSASILASLLAKDDSKVEADSLSSFLDTVVGGIND